MKKKMAKLPIGRPFIGRIRTLWFWQIRSIYYLTYFGGLNESFRQKSYLCLQVILIGPMHIFGAFDFISCIIMASLAYIGSSRVERCISMAFVNRIVWWHRYHILEPWLLILHTSVRITFVYSTSGENVKQMETCYNLLSSIIRCRWFNLFQQDVEENNNKKLNGLS